MNEEMSQQVTEIKGDLSKLRSDMSDLFQAFLEAGKAQTSEARQQIETRINQRVEDLRHTMDATRERSRLAIQRLNTTVEQNPTTSVLTAVGVGFLIGFLMRRKNP